MCYHFYGKYKRIKKEDSNMTVMEIAKTFNLQPKDVTAFILANATFPVKRNFQTGEISIPDDVDIKAFMMPMLEKVNLDKYEQEKRAADEKRRKEQLAVEAKIQQENRARREAELQHSVAVEALKKTGAEGYYQYKAISLMDVGGLFRSNSGRVNTEAMTQTLNALGMEGWHLVTAYSNELGKNAMSGGAGGVLLGTNSTVDENILIFERFVRF
jgi:hypothetical protein